MFGIGILFILGGVGSLIYSFVMDVSAASAGATSFAGVSIDHPEQIANLDLLARRELIGTMGVGLLIAGILICAAVQIVEELGILTRWNCSCGTKNLSLQIATCPVCKKAREAVREAMAT